MSRLAGGETGFSLTEVEAEIGRFTRGRCGGAGGTAAPAERGERIAGAAEFVLARGIEIQTEGGRSEAWIGGTLAFGFKGAEETALIAFAEFGEPEVARGRGRLGDAAEGAFEMGFVEARFVGGARIRRARVAREEAEGAVREGGASEGGFAAEGGGCGGVLDTRLAAFGGARALGRGIGEAGGRASEGDAGGGEG